MNRVKRSPSASDTQQAPARAPKESTHAMRVAYRRGPPAITFYGLDWRRGQARTVSIAEWVRMNQRPDIAAFDFHEVHDQE